METNSIILSNYKNLAIFVLLKKKIQKMKLTKNRNKILKGKYNKSITFNKNKKQSSF